MAYGANESALPEVEGWPRYVRITDVLPNGTLKLDTRKSIDPTLAQPYMLGEGDILFARSGSVGRTFVYREDWGRAAHAGYLIKARLDLTRVLPQFVAYYTQSPQYWNWLNAISIKTTIENVNAEKYASLPLPLPPLDEQRAIARFLDRKSRRIARFIHARQRMIALLNEQKQAIIHQAVTRGLDPDVPRKPSGIDWLGDIPAHWSLRTIKSTLTSVTAGFWGSDEAESDEDVCVPCVRVADFRMTDLGTRDEIPTMRWLPRSAFERRKLAAGDLLIEKSGGGENQPVGRVVQYRLGNDAICSNFVSRLRPGSAARSSFLLFYLADLQARRLNVPSIKQTTGIQNLDQSDYFSNPIPLPPSDEQDSIILLIENERARLAGIIDRELREIDLLREYRTRLIADVVTGKLDVRDHPDAAEDAPDDLDDTDSLDGILDGDVPIVDIEDDGPVDEASG